MLNLYLLINQRVNTKSSYQVIRRKREIRVQRRLLKRKRVVRKNEGNEVRGAIARTDLKLTRESLMGSKDSIG